MTHCRTTTPRACIATDTSTAITDGRKYGPSFRAVEFKTGRVKWSEDQFRAGSVLLAGDKLLIIREAGEIILAPASPEAFHPIARAQILNGVVRPYPALADGFLYVRNENTLVCLDLRRQ